MLVLTYPLLLKFIHNQNINLIVKGTNIDVLDIIEQGHTVCYNYDIQYKTIHNIYSIDLQKNIDNTKIIDLFFTKVWVTFNFNLTPKLLMLCVGSIKVLPT